MIATDVRYLGLGILTAATVTGGALLAPRPAPASAPSMPAPAPASAPSMPAPAPESVSVRQTENWAIECGDPRITHIVFRGTVHSMDPGVRATFWFRFADLPSRYAVMTGPDGSFEVRVPREELGDVDLCQLPSSGRRPASFRDSSMSIQYELTFERLSFKG